MQRPPRERSRNRPDVHLLCAVGSQSVGSRGDRRTGRQDVVNQQHASRWRADSGEGTPHRGAPVRARTRRLRGCLDAATQQPNGRHVELAPERHRERPRLVEATLRLPRARQGHPCDRVDLRTFGRCDGPGERSGDVAPARELQPMHRPLGRPVVHEGGADGRHRGGWALAARRNREHRRRAAPLTPRRPDRSQVGAARRTERPRPVAAAGARAWIRSIEEPPEHNARP